MPFFTEQNTCIHTHSKEMGKRFDPIRSDSNFPEYFCSFNCERDWVAVSLARVTLADVLDIQERAFVSAGIVLSAVAGR